MQELQKIIQENQLANITTPNPDYVKQLFHINYLTSYPISDIMLEGYSVSIQELVPEISVKDIKEIIDRMKLGSIDFDSKKGVQNIFKGYVVLLKEKLILAHKANNEVTEPYDYANNKPADTKIKWLNEIERINLLIKKLGSGFNAQQGLL